MLKWLKTNWKRLAEIAFWLGFAFTVPGLILLACKLLWGLKYLCQ